MSPDVRPQAQFFEPLSAWYAYAAKARIILRIAADLHRENAIPKQDWNQFWRLCLYRDGPNNEQFIRLLENPGFGRAMVSTAVGDWMRDGNVGPVVTWQNSDRPEFLLGAWTYGLLGVQLMHAVTKSHGPQFCDGCGGLYTPTRQPRRDRAKYCIDCGSGSVANKLRQRRWREKSPNRK